MILPRVRPRRQSTDPRTMTSADWDSVVGNKQATTTTYTTLSQLPGNGINPGVVTPLTNALIQIPAGASPNYSTLFDISNSTINNRIYMGHSTANTSFLTMRNCTVNVPMVNMSPGQTNGGCLDGTSMSLYGVDVVDYMDGAWPGDGNSVAIGKASTIDLCRFTGAGGLTFIGYPLLSSNIPATVIGLAGTTGTYLTSAQLASVMALQPSTVYTAGQFIVTTNGSLYQVSTGGTTGSGLVSGQAWWAYWIGSSLGPSQTMFKDLLSTDTTQPFADGPNTLKLVFVGTFMHNDGIQVARTAQIDVTRCKFSGYSNDCFFIQGSAQSYDSSSNPSGPISITDCDLEAMYLFGSYGQWIYVNTNTVDPNYPGKGILIGRWLRTTAGVWSANTQPWFSRPEGITIVGNLFRNRVGDPAGGSPQMSGPSTATTPPNINNLPIWAHSQSTWQNGSGAPTTGDWAVFVPSAAVRDAGIAAQWTTPPSSTTTDAGAVMNTAVLEARYQYGIFPGACDARSWIVWSGNVDQTGAVINPIFRASISGFDSQGYYTGI